MWIVGRKGDNDDLFWGDLYLDLQCDDRDDPPVIGHNFYEEEPKDLGPESVFASRFSDFIQSIAYEEYEQINNMVQYCFSIQFSKKKTAIVWEGLRDLFRSTGWRECLPGSDSAWFGQHDEPLSIDAKIEDRGSIRVLVGANDRSRVLSMVAEIKDEFPRMANPGNWFIERDKEWTT